MTRRVDAWAIVAARPIAFLFSGEGADRPEERAA
jgi:hypothetical protein